MSLHARRHSTRRGILGVVAAVTAAIAQLRPTLLLAQPLSHVANGALAPNFTLVGMDGRRHRLTDYRGKIVVLEWTSPVCPFTQHQYKIKAMQASQIRARRMGAVWLAINTSSPGKPGYMTPGQTKRRMQALGARVATLLFDDRGKVGRAYGAKTTPALYVIGKTGRLLYQGAYDDDGLASGTVNHRYVDEALHDLAMGRSVRIPQSQQYGCAVEY